VETSRGEASILLRLPEGLKDNVGNLCANRLCASLVVGMRPIGENNYINPAGRVADNRCPRVAAVAECVLRRV